MRGRALEQALDAYHALLRGQGRALVVKVPTPTQITRRHKTPAGKLTRRVDGRLERRVWSDYTGLLAGGRAVAIEAKQCGDHQRFPFSTLADHQRQTLRVVAELGGVAFVYARKTTRPTGDYVFTADLLDAVEASGRKSIRWDSEVAQQCRLAPGQGWLDVVTGEERTTW